jgi:glycine cleavage system aminomethyltransferase T
VWPQAHADHILKDGHPVGISSGTIYSYYFHEVLSMGCVDLDASKIGTEVIVQWGDHGGRIKQDKECPHNGRAFPLPDRRTEQRPRRLHDQVSAPYAVIVPRVPRLYVSSSVTLAKSGM